MSSRSAGAVICRKASLSGVTVDFENVTKSYGRTDVLRPTTLRVEAGEFFGLIGPSGSGKSTLLGILAGFVPPSSGQVSIHGKSVVSVPPYQRNVGMVFQNYALFPHMTVADNVAFPLRMRKVSKAEREARVAKALAMVRLEALADRHPAQLSGGQQQRVALARTAVYEPGLLLMDEPLGALDKNLREEMQEEIKRFQVNLGATVIYVTHDQHEAAFLSHRLAILRDGELQQVGTPRTLYERPQTSFVASFLGEASLLPIKSMAAHQADQVCARTVDGLEVKALAPATSNGPLALCVRPENIRLGGEAIDADNVFEGRVIEALFTTGTIRYRVQIGHDKGLVTVRVPSHPGIELVRPGEPIAVGWDASMATIVAVQ